MTMYRIQKIDGATPPDALNADDVVVWIEDRDNPNTVIRKVLAKPVQGDEELFMEQAFCLGGILTPNDAGEDCV